MFGKPARGCPTWRRARRASAQRPASFVVIELHAPGGSFAPSPARFDVFLSDDVESDGIAVADRGDNLIYYTVQKEGPQQDRSYFPANAVRLKIVSIKAGMAAEPHL